MACSVVSLTNQMTYGVRTMTSCGRCRSGGIKKNIVIYSYMLRKQFETFFDKIHNNKSLTT